MTAAQTKARARFKAAVKEAAKLRAKDPKLSQAEAVKKAWAILYGKKVGAAPKKTAAKKTAKRKSSETHTDTKSHNVNIRVVSGVRRKKMGALPVGFTGKFLGWAFRVLNQYTIDGGVTAQIVASQPAGELVAELRGITGDDKIAADKIYESVKHFFEESNPYSSKAFTPTQRIYIRNQLTEKQDKDLLSRIKNFTKELNKEVKAYNTGKNKKTTTKKPVKIEYTPTVKKLSVIEQIKNILSDNKKRLKYGYATVPGKVRVKSSDTLGAIMRDAASGIKKYTDHLAAIRSEKKVIKNKSVPPKISEKRIRAAHLADLTRSENMTIKKIAQLKRQIQ